MVPCAFAEPLQNTLRDHPSPYLALHGDDPVAWQAWGPAAFDAARADNRLIMVSVGYFACHWCHVMQRESFRDAAIAARLNADYVSIKVDREQHPGIDARLIDFAERTVGRAGWPLNVFLTPDGYPLVAVLYQPPERFAGVVARLSERWRQEPDKLRDLAFAAQTALREVVPEAGTPVSVATARALLFDTALRHADTLGGGFGQQARFPMSPVLAALLSGVERDEAPDEIREFLITTLDHMAALGLRDHLHGGFFRYTVDPDWHTPHYEKMLYDNAQLAELFVRAARVLARPEYLAVAFDTLDFVLAHMTHPQGGYVSSLSALDAHGHEGGDYLWTRQALREAVDAEAFAMIESVWDLRTPVAGGEGFLPRIASTPAQVAAALGIDPIEAEVVYERARQTLIAARGGYRPPRDDKVIAAWNGLLLRALVAAAGAPGGDRFAVHADELATFVRAAFDSPDGLRRLARNATTPATLEDHVFLAAGIDAWSRWRDDPAARRVAQAWLVVAREQFNDGDGWRRDRDQLLRYGDAASALPDDALPSASAEWERLTATGGQSIEPRIPAAAIADPLGHASLISPASGR
ncbi:MAG: thioredoxin domain-containing protein [Gammaproteobacteria bacterium]|nr:thioredoxin domain-containing protein [Gammaproteobacteria bacterium]